MPARVSRAGTFMIRSLLRTLRTSVERADGCSWEKRRCSIKAKPPSVRSWPPSFSHSLPPAPFRAQDAKPAADPAVANQLDPNAPEKDAKLIDKYQAVKVEDGKYSDGDGAPTYHITNDGKKFDWYAYSGYRRYHAECHVCHGPDAMGSTYAPALKDSPEAPVL